MTLISVIIPTFHRNDALAICLEKIRPQVQAGLGDQFEVIVTDDGREHTAETMIRDRFPWVRWTAGPRQGPAANRNHGVRQVDGKFIVFTDDDCVPGPDWLTSYVSSIEADIDLYEGRTTCEVGIRTPMQEAPINLHGNHLWSCNFMVRRTAFNRLGGFDEAFRMSYGEDVDFHGRANRAGISKKFVSEAVIDHPPRRRPGGLKEGRKWESRALLWFKEGNEAPLWRWMPLHILKIRCHHLLQFPLSVDSFVAAWSAVVEWCFVLGHLSAWERRYRQKMIQQPQSSTSQ